MAISRMKCSASFLGGSAPRRRPMYLPRGMSTMGDVKIASHISPQGTRLAQTGRGVAREQSASLPALCRAQADRGSRAPQIPHATTAARPWCDVDVVDAPGGVHPSRRCEDDAGGRYRLSLGGMLPPYPRAGTAHGDQYRHDNVGPGATFNSHCRRLRGSFRVAMGAHMLTTGLIHSLEADTHGFRDPAGG
jgi:hypothetical protein